MPNDKKRTPDELKCCYMLRQCFSRSFLYWGAMRRVRIASNQYKCEKCSKVFKQREVAVDHTVPVVDPEKGWQGITVFASRLFCDPSNLKVLCKDVCHQTKSNKENKERRKS